MFFPWFSLPTTGWIGFLIEQFSKAKVIGEVVNAKAEAPHCPDSLHSLQKKAIFLFISGVRKGEDGGDSKV